MDWIEFYGPNFFVKAIYSCHDGLAAGVQCLQFLVDYSMVLKWQFCFPLFILRTSENIWRY